MMPIITMYTIVQVRVLQGKPEGLAIPHFEADTKFHNQVANLIKTARPKVHSVAHVPPVMLSVSLIILHVLSLLFCFFSSSLVRGNKRWLRFASLPRPIRYGS
jgi:hypothetical protein